MTATRTTAAVVLKVRTSYVMAAAKCSSRGGFPYFKSPRAFLFVSKSQRGRTYGTAAWDNPLVCDSELAAEKQEAPEPVRGQGC